ncbi:MAG: chemotaxis protein CheW [Planctomycetaceae bacterium]|jgi:chemotaxis protein histidine kinase CheA|nr:chemotaxis protein CheW [Planctomycetaceae bacterium]
MTDTLLNNQTVDRMTVRIEHLDKLLNLAGEVIITSSTLHDLQREMIDAVTYHRPVVESSLQTIKAADEASRRISQDLHDLVMAIRLVEIGETFRMFRRTVRDLSRKLKKEIELEIEGEHVLIDKALAERLVEPMLHLIRNAADHGIEQPLERTRLGKPVQGTIRLEAIEHENDTEILVMDDGRGINESAVIEKAQSCGLIRAGETPDLINILCTSGFSTRNQATDTSGRGVGLDIVRTMVNSFNGAIEIKTQPEKGTLFRFTIPKLRAVNIIDALIVRCSHSLFALAIDKVISLQGIPVHKIQATMDRERFVRYLGEPIALFDLRELLGGGQSEMLKPDIVPIVVIEGKNERIAVIVTEFLSPQKLVNVPLETDMFGESTAPGVAGTCIISGGQVGLTVDVDKIVEMATHFGGESNAVEPDASSLLEYGDDNEESDSGELKRTPTDIPAIEHDAHAELASKEKYQKRFMDKDSGMDSRLYELNAADVADLLDEVRRGLAELQDTLLTFEEKADDKEIMRDIFRRLHALKGSFAMLGANASANLSHRLETLLDYVRKDMIPLEQSLMDIMLDGVSEMALSTKSLPGKLPEENEELTKRINAVIEAQHHQAVVTDERELLKIPFSLPPIVELQLLGSLKNQSHTYETFLRFRPGRQASYLIMYLTLRKLCYFGTILATIPAIDQIEQGACGDAVKILWATQLNEPKLTETLNELQPLYNISEHYSLTTTVFRYDNADALD